MATSLALVNGFRKAKRDNAGVNRAANNYISIRGLRTQSPLTPLRFNDFRALHCSGFSKHNERARRFTSTIQDEITKLDSAARAKHDRRAIQLNHHTPLMICSLHKAKRDNG